jgi:hypothetical protein
MSRHCQHISMAKTCAICAFFFLACSECHGLFNQEAEQSNCGACLGAASGKAEFFVFRFCRCSNATIQQLLTGTKRYQNGIIIYLPESQDNRGFGGMLFTATQAQMAPPHGSRQPSVSDYIWSSPGTYGIEMIMKMIMTMAMTMMNYNCKERQSRHQLGFSKGRHGAHSEW